MPRVKEILVFGDNIDKVRPGQEVFVTGVYQANFDFRVNQRHGFPLFRTFIESNLIEETKLCSSNIISQADIQEIENLSKQSNVLDLICKSFAQSIFG